MARPLPVCADESCHDRADLAALRGKYDMVNIKLDKAGGLTEALALRDAARAAGFRVMVGCMVGSSLGMAPAVLVAQGAAVTDLDGPLLLARDRAHGLVYDAAGVHPSVPELWG
jgi:L-alanine-DL-glutamate epimerase-like enolase superfamily enzyme